MKSEQLEQVLRDMGLSEGGARLYLTMLENGPSTVLRISQLSGLRRTTIYGLIDQLKELGIARIDVHGFKKLYAAEPPAKLESVITARKLLLDKYLPDLEKITGTDATSFLKIYEGVAAVKGVYEDLIKTVQPGDDYLVLSNQADWKNIDEPFFTHFLERRAKLPIKIRMILQDSESARQTYKFQKNINSKVKLLSPETKINTNLVVIPQRVVIQQLKSPVFAIVIENESVIRMHREMFEIIWNSLLE